MGLEVRLELLLLYCEFDVVVVALDGLQHTPAYAITRQHTSAYVRMRKYVAVALDGLELVCECLFNDIRNTGSNELQEEVGRGKSRLSAPALGFRV